MSDPKEPNIRLCQSCGFRLPYTAAPDDTLCAECKARREPTIRICIGCGVELECVCFGDILYQLCEECEQGERSRDEANRRLSVLADLERRAEDE